ncbi:hypothetical protein [Actinoplanes sp. OR16]|uniref:hypothetical protein n=1 Tax=Actinoplanes sp. OR16 TaxID=946334 RepID=UPI000FD9FFC5|nr:hypothetical protein [Actinoplanes sp. OR16]
MRRTLLLAGGLALILVLILVWATDDTLDDLDRLASLGAFLVAILTLAVTLRQSPDGAPAPRRGVLSRSKRR